METLLSWISWGISTSNINTYADSIGCSVQFKLGILARIASSFKNTCSPILHIAIFTVFFVRKQGRKGIFFSPSPKNCRLPWWCLVELSLRFTFSSCLVVCSGSTKQVVSFFSRDLKLHLKNYVMLMKCQFVLTHNSPNWVLRITRQMGYKQTVCHNDLSTKILYFYIFIKT